MSRVEQHQAVHSLVVSAPARILYDLVADVTRWPVIFEPTLHVQRLDFGDDRERFQIWALVNGEAKTWTSRRTFRPADLLISFEQEHSRPPVASMAGEWQFRELGGGRTEIVLTHRFAVHGGEAELEWMNRALDTNSARELAALGRFAELGVPVEDLVFSFTDETRVTGTAADAYEFVDRSDRWPERLPHVSRVVLHEDQAGVQDMEMDTVTADGHTHTTRSIRLCFAPDRIVYKQLVPPALLLGHSGSWSFTDGPEGAGMVARHTVAVNPEAVPKVLGPGAGLAEARQYLRDALGRNSRATMEHAGAYAGRRAAAAATGDARG